MTARLLSPQRRARARPLSWRTGANYFPSGWPFRGSHKWTPPPREQSSCEPLWLPAFFHPPPLEFALLGAQGLFRSLWLFTCVCMCVCAHDWIILLARLGKMPCLRSSCIFDILAGVFLHSYGLLLNVVAFCIEARSQGFWRRVYTGIYNWSIINPELSCSLCFYSLSRITRFWRLARFFNVDCSHFMAWEFPWNENYIIRASSVQTERFF